MKLRLLLLLILALLALVVTCKKDGREQQPVRQYHRHVSQRR